MLYILSPQKSPEEFKHLNRQKMELSQVMQVTGGSSFFSSAGNFGIQALSLTMNFI